MKAMFAIAAGLALAAGSVAAHDHGGPAAPATVPPPPGINQPGVKPVPPAPAHAASTPSERIDEMRRTLDQDADVQVRRAGDKVIEEYRRDGRLYMVRVTPPHGVPQTYMVDPNGRLRAVSGAPPVSPVMYKILDFGKPPASSSSDQGDHGGGG